jgi:hypothetical protein
MEAGKWKITHGKSPNHLPAGEKTGSLFCLPAFPQIHQDVVTYLS